MFGENIYASCIRCSLEFFTKSYLSGGSIRGKIARSVLRYRRSLKRVLFFSRYTHDLVHLQRVHAER